MNDIKGQRKRFDIPGFQAGNGRATKDCHFYLASGSTVYLIGSKDWPLSSYTSPLPNHRAQDSRLYLLFTSAVCLAKQDKKKKKKKKVLLSLYIRRSLTLNL